MLIANRDSSVVRPMRRCQSDLGYVSQETANSDVSTSLLRPRVGVCKKPASDVCTASNAPGANSVVNRPSKLRAKVSDTWLSSFHCHCAAAISPFPLAVSIRRYCYFAAAVSSHPSDFVQLLMVLGLC